MMKNILLIEFILFSCFTASGQDYEFVKIIPGQSVIINKDTIKLNKTSINEVCDIFKINSDSLIMMSINWDDLESRSSGVDYMLDIKYKSIYFQYFDTISENTLRLKRISIRENQRLKAYTTNGLELGKVYPNILDEYSKCTDKQSYSSDSLKTNLCGNGLTLIIDSDWRLIEISIQKEY